MFFNLKSKSNTSKREAFEADSSLNEELQRRVHDETIDRWRKRSTQDERFSIDAASLEDEDVRLVTGTEAESSTTGSSTTIHLKDEVMEPSPERRAEPQMPAANWSVDESFLRESVVKEVIPEKKSWIERQRAFRDRLKTEEQAQEVKVAPVIPPSRPETLEPVVKVQKAAPVATATESSNATVVPSNTALSVDEDLKRRFGGNIRSALGSGTVIEGKMSFDTPVRIDGTIDGEIHSTSTLIVGEQAIVKAVMEVGSLIVLGQVTGNVVASDLIEIRRGGQLEGDIKSPRFVMEQGGFFEGMKG